MLKQLIVKGNDKMKRAIVLSGGGSKGSYQIGAWKALKRMHIKYDIVTGTSVGALNGALMVQKSYLKGLWFWYNIDYKYIIKEPICDNMKNQKSVLKHYAKAILLANGMDVSNLEETINKVLNERKVRKSKINFGIITFNLSNFKPKVLTKKDIPIGKLKDYLMASATCFPAFKKKHIDNDDYIDGGYYDNLPINLAIDMGAEEIIAVDLRAVGLKRQTKSKNVKVTYISPRNKLGSFLIFDKNIARRGMRLGYNDTMKTFGKLDGNKYTFKKDHLKRNFNRYSYTYRQILTNIFKRKNDMLSQLLKITAYKADISISYMTEIIESLGMFLNLDDSYIYNINIYNKRLLYRLNQLPSIDRKLVKQKIKDNEWRDLIQNKVILKYIYDDIVAYQNSKTKKDLSNIALLFPNEFLGALYLYVISNSK